MKKRTCFQPLAGVAAVIFVIAAMFLFSCDTAVSLGGGGDGNSSGDGSGNSGGGVKKYTLAVSASPAGVGTVSLSPNLSSYEAGTYVTATASPAADNYKFSRWSGAATSTSGSVSIVMDADKTLTANFEQKQAASGVIITLTYWQTTDTDAGGLDPTIYFRVYDGTYHNTENLLYATDIGQTWSGSSSSSTVYFSASAGYIRIEAVVKERDLLFDDDISPNTSTTFYLPVYVGDSGSKTLGYGGGKSTVTYSYRFVY